jgi:RND family efflux transporter MFP subunit
VETVPLKLNDDLKFVRSYLATIEAFEKVDLCARVQAGTTGLRGMRGFVKSVPKEIDIGLQVRAGQPLIQLELPDLAADQKTKQAMLGLADNALLQAEQAIQVAAADIKEAEAQVQRYEADVAYKMVKQKRVEGLVQSTAVSLQLKEEVDLELQTSQAALQTARAQVTTKKARYEAAVREKDVAASKVLVARSELDTLNTLAGFTNVSAPFPAVITKRWVNSGDTIRDAAMPLLTVQRTDIMRVLIDIPEREVRYLHTDGADQKGNEVVIRIPTLDEKEGTFPGTLTLKADALDPVTRTMRTEVHLYNAKGFVKPNMTGTADVTLDDHRKVFTVPSTALVRRGDKIELFYVEITDSSHKPPMGTLRRIRVELGLDDGHEVEILSKDLKKDMLVVVKGNGVLRDGDTVRAIAARGSNADGVTR